MPKLFPSIPENNESSSLMKRSHLKQIEIVIAVIIFVSTTILISATIDPADIFRRSRDGKRLDDLSKIRSALDIYRPNHSFKYPPSLTALNIYLSPIPVDPLTKLTYGYAINDDLTEFELSANLESNRNYFRETNDGGDNDSLYEIGTNLTLVKEGLYNNQGMNPSPKKFKIIGPTNQKQITYHDSPEGCRIQTTLTWEEAEDPGDRIIYYYYMDDNEQFSDPVISGNTRNLTFEVDKLLEDETCEEVPTIDYLLVIAEDSEGSLVEAPPFKVGE